MKTIVRISKPRDHEKNYLLESIMQLAPQLINPKNQKIFEEEIKNAEIFVGNFISAEELFLCENLKYIICPTSSTEGLPKNILETRGIKLIQNKEIFGESVAHHIIDSLDKVGVKKTSKGLAGILGFGNIGKRLYTSLKELGYDISILKKDINSLNLNRYHLKSVYLLPKINSIFSNSDLLINTLPSDKSINQSCYGLVNLLNDGAVLVDISHRGIFNENEILSCLECGKLAGLIMDHYPDNKLLQDYKKFNVILSPHTAWMYKGGVNKISQYVLKTLENIWEGVIK